MKCFNCGKDVKNNLRFCTNCGVSLDNDMDKSVEIISNKEDEGRDIANDKTAILVIILSLNVFWPYIDSFPVVCTKALSKGIYWLLHCLIAPSL